MIVKTLARELQPGNIVREPLLGIDADRAVVLCVAATDAGPVGLQLGRLGEIPPHLNRVATVSWPADFEASVERDDLTPAQAAAGELLEVVRAVARGVAPHPDTARALVDKIEPPAPTLEEALEQLQAVHDAKHPGDELIRVGLLLERARAAGVLPRA